MHISNMNLSPPNPQELSLIMQKRILYIKKYKSTLFNIHQILPYTGLIM